MKPGGNCLSPCNKTLFGKPHFWIPPSLCLVTVHAPKAPLSDMQSISPNKEATSKAGRCSGKFRYINFLAQRERTWEERPFTVIPVALHQR